MAKKTHKKNTVVLKRKGQIRNHKTKAEQYTKDKGRLRIIRQKRKSTQKTREVKEKEKQDQTIF